MNGEPSTASSSSSAKAPSLPTPPPIRSILHSPETNRSTSTQSSSKFGSSSLLASAAVGIGGSSSPLLASNRAHSPAKQLTAPTPPARPPAPTVLPSQPQPAQQAVPAQFTQQQQQTITPIRSILTSSVSPPRDRLSQIQVTPVTTTSITTSALTTGSLTSTSTIVTVSGPGGISVVANRLLHGPSPPPLPVLSVSAAPIAPIPTAASTTLSSSSSVITTTASITPPPPESSPVIVVSRHQKLSPETPPPSMSPSLNAERRPLLALPPDDETISNDDDSSIKSPPVSSRNLLGPPESGEDSVPTSPGSPPRRNFELSPRFARALGGNADRSAAMKRRRQTIFVSDRSALARTGFAQQQMHHEMHDVPSAHHGFDPRDPDSHWHGDDLIVTPFAQILASLRNVRTNYMQLTRLPLGRTKSGVRQQQQLKSDSSATPLSHIDPAQCPQTDPLNTTLLIDDEYLITAAETFDELQWCLEQLEQVHARRSVADMATVKFRQMLNRELSNFSSKGAQQGGNQVTNYIVSTFLETNNDLDATGSSADEGMSTSSSIAQSIPPNPSSRPSVTLISNSIARFGIHFESEAQMAQLEELLPTLDFWGPDIFTLAKTVAGRPLTAAAYHIFKKRDLLAKFSILPTRFLQFITRLEDRYRPETAVAYHNSQHAADVIQTAHVLLNADALQNVFSDIEILSVLFASAIHDVDHPGLINQYLVNTCHDLAILYNDISVLENHHLAVAFALLREDGCDIFTGLSSKQRQQVRKLTIDMVLATDMSKHMSLLADLKTMVETKKVTSSGVIILDNYTDKLTVLQNLIHCGDLSNPTKPLPLYQEWLRRLLNEFWNQGDIERRLKLEISPMCDRHNANIEKSQVGFIDYIVHPLWETWAELVQPDAQEILDQLEENRNYFHSKMEEQQQQQQEKDSSGTVTPTPSSSSSSKP